MGVSGGGDASGLIGSHSGAAAYKAHPMVTDSGAGVPLRSRGMTSLGGLGAAMAGLQLHHHNQSQQQQQASDDSSSLRDQVSSEVL
jgi:hypothetical protein